MIAKKLRTKREIMPQKKNLGIGDPDSFPLKLRVYRAWEIAGTQDTATDTKTKSVILHQCFYITLISIRCQHNFYFKF